MEKKANLISIVSPGHSGSTLLDMALGTLPKVTSSGEIIYLPWKLYKEKSTKHETTYCSCGKTTSDCLRWRKIIEECSKQKEMDIVNNPDKFNIWINKSMKYGKNIKYAAFKKMVFYLSKTVNIIKLFKIISPFYKKSIMNNWLLFNNTKKITGNNYVVDSTKDLYRYLFLRNYFPQETKLIILIRDIEGVVSSDYYNNNEKEIMRRAKYWLKLYNESIYNVIKQLKNEEYLIINYKELAQNFNLTRMKLAKFLNITENIPDISKVYPPKMHILAGNPARLKESMIIVYDEKWKKKLSEELKEKLLEIKEKLNPVFK